jgi:RHS repeat-associated protein
MSYDVLGRMVSRAEPEYITTWTYDKYANASVCAKGIGKLCEVGTSHGVNRKLRYDTLGRPINARTTITSGPSFASVLAYNSTTGRVTSQTYPTGLKVNYSYTAKGFLERMTLATAATVNPLPATPGGTPGASVNLTAGSLLWQARVSNAWGKVEQHSYGNGVINRAAYQSATGRVATLGAGPGATDIVLSHTYSWDSIGNLSSRADAIGDGGGAVTETFNYDAINRLTQYEVMAPAIVGLLRRVTLQYNAIGSLLYKSDVGAFSYNASGGGSVRPHAVAAVNGAAAVSYGYDPNGNLASATGGKYAGITYTSFNLPDSQGGVANAGGGTRTIWQYDENHARIKEVRTIASGTQAGTRTTWYAHPDNTGGLAFEHEVNSPTTPSAANPAVTSNRHYLSAGGVTIGVMVSTGALPALTATAWAPPAVSTITLVKVEYWHKDHLGSLAATTDHAATVTARMAYDPFGKRRFASGFYDLTGQLVIDYSAAVSGGTDRGFTGHEHLDELGLIHMNGRLYDPHLGVFLQADPFIQEALNLQSYNRYMYCMAGPLACTDPSGYLSSLQRRLNRHGKWLPGFHILKAFSRTETGRTVVSIAIGVASYWCGPAAAVCNGAGQAAWASFNGASTEEAIKTGVIAGATTAAFSAVGDIAPGAGQVGAGGVQATAGTIFWNTVGHAAVGCASAAASGGSCRSGAISGAFSAAWGNYVGHTGNFGADLVINAVVGGTGSVLGGGKFSNGAVTGAFGYLFNYLAHVHKDLTYRAARMAGLNLLASDLLSGATVMIDFQGPSLGGSIGIEFASQDVEHSHMHAMCAGGSSAALCDLKIADYREKLWEMKSMAGLAGLLHLYQDSFAPGHANLHPYNGSVDWQHIQGDRSPPPALASQIVRGSAEIIKNYLNNCQCGR